MTRDFWIVVFLACTVGIVGVYALAYAAGNIAA